MWESEFWQRPRTKVLVGLVGLLLFLSLTYLLRTVLVPVLFAFIVAYVFDPVVDYLERVDLPRFKRKIPRMTAVIALVLALLLFMLSFPVVILPGVFVEASRLVESAKQDLGDKWLNEVLDRLPLRAIVEQMGWVPAGQTEFDERAVLAEGLGKLVREEAAGLFKSDAASGAGSAAGHFFASMTSGVMKAALFVGNFALFTFISIYLLRDYDRIVSGAHELVPPRYRNRVDDIMHRIDMQLRGFLRGQMAVCGCLAMMYCAGLKLSGTPFAIQLGLFGGLASFVPYLGISLTILPALILTMLRHGIDGHLVGVLLTFGIAQALEGNILTPRIVGSQVGLNPVWIILAIMVFSSLFGFLGLLLAVPLAAILKVLVVDALAYYRTSPWFAGEDS